MRKNSRFGLILGLCLSFMLAPSVVWASEEAKPAGGSDGPIFVKINPINIPVIRKNGTTSMLSLDILAEVKNEEDKIKVETWRPILRDAFIRALYGNLEMNKLVRADGMLDMDRVKQRLMQGSVYVMKKETITDLLINGVSHRAF